VAVVCLSKETASAIFKNAKAIDSGAPLFCLSGQQLPEVYKTDGIPATFVIDKDGMIVYEHLGTADWSHSSVIKFIDALRQRPPEKLDAQTVDNQHWMPFQFLGSLHPVGRGWGANQSPI
jgi:hypothetical protein